MNRNSDYVAFIAMVYITIDLASMVFAYKIIEVGPVIGAASSLIFPLTYSTMDIIAEIYGYQMAKKIVWYGLICDLIFSTLVLLISHVPSTTPSESMAYRQVLGLLPRAVIAQISGALSGSYINIYLVSKWKIMTNGKYFWLRSIGSSAIGEAIMLVISVFIALTGLLSFSKLILLIMYAYLYKIFFAIVISPFVSIVALVLKKSIVNWRAESVDFNPFNISNKPDFSSNFQKS